MSAYPVKLSVVYPEKSSRATLLLRTFFGFFYVLIPHGICLMFYAFAAMFVTIIAWFAVLFSGKYPKDMFNFLVGFQRWSTNINAYMNFLTDEYPPFSGKEKQDYPVKLIIEYPESLSRGILLLRTFLGWLYIGIPHGFCLAIFSFISFFISVISWFAILFMGKFPKDFFDIVTGYYRWNARVSAYMMFFTDAYPPFNTEE
jgi:hypothetical protein